MSRALPRLREAQAEERDGDEVKADDAEIERMQPTALTEYSHVAGPANLEARRSNLGAISLLPMPLYLAINAGGTKTRCVLADDDQILARAASGTVKFQRVSESKATARLTALLQEVAAAAGISLSDVTRTCVGLTGLSSHAIRDWATGTISALAGGSLILCGDGDALDAAFAGGSGILIIAGTGSNAIGRSADGSCCGAGGWGPVLGDEGSGYWIGLEAIRGALRAQDRAPGCANPDAPLHPAGRDPSPLAPCLAGRSGCPGEPSMRHPPRQRRPTSRRSPRWSPAALPRVTVWQLKSCSEPAKNSPSLSGWLPAK